jgi:hypothetical protein
VKNYREVIENVGPKKLSLKMLRDDWGLLDKLDDIAVILNEATNIYNLNNKLKSIKKELSIMQLKIKKHDLTGIDEHTWLLEGPSIEEN